LIEHEKLEQKKQFVKQSRNSNRSSSVSELKLESKLKAQQTVLDTEKLKSGKLFDEVIKLT